MISGIGISLCISVEQYYVEILPEIKRSQKIEAS
jgi:hypothetical protein